MTLPPTPYTLHPVSRSTVRAWMLSRTPVPPADLAVVLSSILDAAPDSAFEGRSLSAVLGRLSIMTLDEKRPAGDAALFLLASDALVTYAFEAAAEEGEDLTAVAERLLGQVRA